MNALKIFHYIFWILLLAGSVALHLQFVGYAADDAYIHFRIAENFLNNGQPYFNPGEAVMATSSSLWTIVLASLFSLSGVKIEAVSILNACLLWIACLCWGEFFSRMRVGNATLNRILGGLVVFCILERPSLTLMETPMAMALWGFSLCLGNRPVSFLPLALASATRPELTIPLGLSFLVQVLKGRNLLALRLAWLLAGLSVPLIFALHYFATLIPHTIQAKRIVYQLSWSESLKVIVDRFIGSDFALEYRALTAIYLVLIFGFTLFLIFRANFSKIKFKLPIAELTVVIVSGVLILQGYLLSSALIFSWYPPLYLLPLCIGLLSTFAIEKLRHKMMVLLLLLPLFAGTGRDAFAALVDRSLLRDFSSEARVCRYLQVGSELRKTNPEATLLTSEIGALGFSFKGKVLDGAGLVTPAALAFHPLRIPEERGSGLVGGIPAGFIKSSKPELIVSFGVFLPDHVIKSLGETYILTQTGPICEADAKLSARPANVFGSSQLNILKRRL